MPVNSRPRFFFPVIIIILSVLSCGQPGQNKSAATSSDSSSLSSARATIKYAKGFRIDYYDHYKILSLLDRVGDKTDTLHYLLLPEGGAPPSDHPGLPVITIPVKSLVVMSSSHVGLTEFDGVADRITS